MGDGDVEVGPATLHPLGEIVRPDEVRTRLVCLPGRIAFGEDGDRYILAEALGEREGAAQLLLGVADVDPEADVELDGLVELGAGRLLDQVDGLGGRIGPGPVDLLVGLSVALAAGH